MLSDLLQVICQLEQVHHCSAQFKDTKWTQRDAKTCSKAAWIHSKRPGLQTFDQQDLCTSLSTLPLPFLSQVFHYLSFFKPLQGLRHENARSHAVQWFPLMHFKPDLQLLCLFTLEPSLVQGPASRCVLLPCAQRNEVKPLNNLPVLANLLL